MESRSKKFFYNTLFTALLQVVNVAAAVIVPRLMLGFYGSEINGLVTYDRKVEKLEAEKMLPVAKALQQAVEK